MRVSNSGAASQPSPSNPSSRGGVACGAAHAEGGAGGDKGQQKKSSVDMGSDGSQTRKTGEGGGECRAWLLQCMRRVTMHMQETGLGEKGVANAQDR